MSDPGTVRKVSMQVDGKHDSVVSAGRRASTMAEAEDKISDLAKSSTHQEKKTWIPGIPLLILAPLLVLIALVGVIVPVSIRA